MLNTNRNSNLSTTDRQCKVLMLTVIIVGVLSFLLCLGTAANAQSVSDEAQTPGGSPQGSRFTDPTEGAFSMDVPAGYQVEGGVYRFGYLDVRWTTEIRSLDGEVIIRIDDPNVPPYIMPYRQWRRTGQPYEHFEVFQGVVYEYQKAESYAETYARWRFASVCTSLTAIHSGWSPSMPKDWQYASGVRTSQASVEFDCAASGGPRIASVFARTSIQGKQGLWVVDPIISILAPPDRLQQAREMTQKMIDSWQETPKWKDFQESMERIGLKEMKTNPIWTTEIPHPYGCFDPPRPGVSKFQDPLTGITFWNLSGPKANDSIKDQGVGVNSNQSPGPGFQQVTNTEQ